MPFVDDVTMVPTLGRWTCGWRAQLSEQTPAPTAKGVSQAVAVEGEVVRAEQVPNSDGRCYICTEQKERGQHVGAVEAAGPAPEPGLEHHRPKVDTKVDSPWRFVSSPKSKGSASLRDLGTDGCLYPSAERCLGGLHLGQRAICKEGGCRRRVPSRAKSHSSTAHARRAEVFRPPSRCISSAIMNRDSDKR